MTTNVSNLDPPSLLPDETTSSSGTWSRLARSPRFLFGVVVLGVFIVIAIVGPYVAPYDPSALGVAGLQGPSLSHWLGTTQTGQDVFSQLLISARVSLIIGFLAGSIATAFSILVGVSAGYLGGLADDVLSLFSNMFLVIPALPLLIVVTGYLKGSGAVTIAIVIAATGWAWGARILRAQTLSIRNRDYVQSARLVGERRLRIILFEVLPNELAIVASSFLFTVLFAILTQVSLAFLGLVNVNQWSWGVMLYWAQNNEALNLGAWWWFAPPGLCVALVGTALVMLNFGIDEFIDPRLRAAGISRKYARTVGRRTARPARADVRGGAAS
jgi:ABC-type dipeptide/oligopeptide/nickel transport system permease subunit